MADKLCTYFKFDEKDSEFFLLLIQYSQCSVEYQKRLYGRQLVQHMKVAHEAPTEVSPEAEVLQNPLALVLRNLLTFADFEKTTANISKIMGLPPAEVEDLLQKLSLSDLVVQLDDGWASVHENITISDRADKSAIRNYHRLCLQKAIKAQELPVDERYYRALNMALSKEEYASYLEDLNEFLTKTFVKYNRNELNLRRIYQIHITLFPWTLSAAVLKE